MSADPSSAPGELLSFAIDEAGRGRRIDAFLAERISDCSRAEIRRQIDRGHCRVDGVVVKASHRLKVGESVALARPAPPPAGPQAEAIPLDVLYEDDCLAVVNKPAGMVVHPARGHWAGTLASAAAHHFGPLSTAGGTNRPGIVHRLDRDTSGVIILAKTDAAHAALAQQFHDRTVEKHYLAIVAGCPDRDRDRITQPIGPHPSQREKMAIRPDRADARAAETFYEVRERYRGFALVRAEPKTGRTHQIRLHLMYAGHPVLCDRLYGGRSRLTAGELRRITRAKRLVASLPDDGVLLDRQALHAQRLALAHPASGKSLEFTAPLPADLEQLVLVLRQASAAG